jgi:hypothetical protein
VRASTAVNGQFAHETHGVCCRTDGRQQSTDTDAVEGSHRPSSVHSVGDERIGPKPILTAYDRGGIEDTTELRAGNPRLRLEDMDRDRVWAHLVFGPVTSIKTADEAFMRDFGYAPGMTTPRHFRERIQAEGPGDAQAGRPRERLASPFLLHVFPAYGRRKGRGHSTEMST